MMFHGLTAFVHGAIAALVALLPAATLMWIATRSMQGGPRALRALVITVATFGAMLLVSAGWSAGFERPMYHNETVMGGVTGGAILAVLLFLLLLLILPRRAPGAAP